MKNGLVQMLLLILIFAVIVSETEANSSKTVVQKQAQTGSSINEDKVKGLFDGEWILIRIDGRYIRKPRPTLVFNQEGGNFRGYSGCNRIFGGFRVDKATVSISKIKQTKRACANAKEVETPFTKNLAAASKFKLEKERLIL